MRQLIYALIPFAAACSSGTGYMRSLDPIPAQSGLVVVTTGYSYEYRPNISALAPVETDPRSFTGRHLDVGPRCNPANASLKFTGPGGNVTISSDSIESYNPFAGKLLYFSAAAYTTGGGYAGLTENRDIFTFKLPAGKYTLRVIECQPPEQESSGPGLAGLAVDFARSSQRITTAITQRIEFEVKPGTITHLGQIEVFIKSTRTGVAAVNYALTAKTSEGLTDREIREDLLRGEMAHFPIIRASAVPSVQSVSP